ncbi:MAG TPA: ribulose-phosphate 3-epimerase, partial [Candidatus Thalassarchaeaceae archaeon]
MGPPKHLRGGHRINLCLTIGIQGIENLLLLAWFRAYMDVTPSILTADFCKLGETLDEAIEAGINWIHMDVMDGNWVINKTITFGPAIIRSVRERLGDEVFIDCHLMINNAEETWIQYVDAGVDMIIAHIEAVQDFPNLISEVQSTGTQIGCVLNPDTEIEEVMPLLPDLDLVLVMSVVPGKGGQSFIPEVEHKVKAFREAIDEQENSGGKTPILMIDGGIKHHNAAMVSEWGIDIAVVGSGL